RSATLSEVETPPHERAIPEKLKRAQPLLYGFALAWLRAGRGEPASIDSEQLGEARRARLAEAVVDAAALDALDALFSPTVNVSSALQTTRTAAMKARSEGIAERELFAGLLLARARRLDRKAYLAVHILHAIESAFPKSWHDWVETERLLSGDAVDTPEGKRSRAILALLKTPGSAQLTALRSMPPSRWSPELNALCQQLGLSETDGFSNRLPLFGIRDPLAEEASWEIVARPDGRVFRRLVSGRVPGELDFAPPSRGPRAALGVAALAEGGTSGLAMEAWFRRVFGFRFVEESHANLARVTLHRMRKGLPDGCGVERNGEQLVLKLSDPLRIPAAEARLSIEE
ncbi:MAG: hypothetical protein AAFQ82_28260, partial [Myxococcota bacterium]